MTTLQNFVAAIKKVARTAILIGVASLEAASAFGQGNNLDEWQYPRMLVVMQPTNFIGGGVLPATNGPFLIRSLDGIARMDFWSVTNKGSSVGTNAGQLTVTVYASPDQTNLFALTNYSLVNSNSTFTDTNIYYGANTNYGFQQTNGLLSTNVLLYPFTQKKPSIGGGNYSSWVTPYNVPFPYTNGGSFTLPANGYASVGFQIGDLQGQYIYVVVSTNSAVNQTNFSFGGTLLGIPRQK